MLEVTTRGVALCLAGTLVLAACGDRVSLGGGGSGGAGASGGATGGAGLEPTGGMGVAGGSIGEPCFDVPCGTLCEPPLPDECLDDEPCPVGAPWFCNDAGFCEPEPPLCDEDPCANADCGSPCEACEPEGGPCLIGVCDGFGFCAPDALCAEEPPCLLDPLSCGDFCDPCVGWFPPESCPYFEDPSPFFVCHGSGECVPSDQPTCPPYDSCIELGLPMCEPCSNCPPNDPTCPPEPPKFCDALGMCSEIADPSCP